MNNIKIGRRILIGLSLLVAPVLLQGFISIHSLDTINQKTAKVAHDLLSAAVFISDIRAEADEYRLAKLRHALTTNRAELDQYEQEMTSAKEQINKYLAAYAASEHATAGSADGKESKLIASFTDDWNSYVSTTETEFIPESRNANQKAEALLSIAASRPLSDRISATLASVIEINRQDGIVTSAEADAIFSDSQKIIWGVFVLALLIAGAAGWYMKNGTKQISQTIKTSVEQLTKLSLALSASTQQASAGAQQNAAIAQQVAAGATQQSRQAGEISKALSEMSQAVRQMAIASKEVSGNAADASTLAQQTGLSTEKISKMAGVVITTAEQTNLLALNAAIEAARAGEAGHGFAVVADEVRKLADSSSKAADDVQQIVKDIAGSIATTIKSIDQSSAKINDVAASINQQAAAITQVAKSMDSIAAVAEQSASGAQQLSASTQQTSAATQQVAAASTDLQRLASQLQKIAGNTIAQNASIAATAAADKASHTDEPK